MPNATRFPEIFRTCVLLAVACLAPAGESALAKSEASAEVVCAERPADDAEKLGYLNTLMLEPRKFTSMADLLKALPPDAMAKFGAMQAAEAERQKKDWANLCRYAAENAQVLASGVRPRVVFVGDSITENWKLGDPALFNATTLDRGIGGQTTPQILLRFYQDVVTLRPRVVHIMAGVNDIMGNNGPTSDATIVNNIRAMIDIAKANGIRVVLAGITPAQAFVVRPADDLRPRIASVNRLLVQLARKERVTFVDYGPVLANSDGGLQDALGNDGLHPNRNGYSAMRPLAERAIARAGR